MDVPHTPPVPSPRPLPPWLRLMDAGAVVLLLLAVWQVLTGGARGGILRFIVPSGVSAALLCYGAGALLVVRHLAKPAPSTLANLQDGWRRIGDSPVWGPAWRPFLATRPMVLIVAFFAVTTLGLGPKPGFRLSDDVLTNLPARFDAGWYGGIAMNGYEWEGTFARQQDVAFFPAMPLLMRVVGNTLGGRDRERPREIRMARILWGGVLISLTAFLLALVYLVKLGTQWIGAERAASAAWLLACYPFAFAYSAPYTESVFLLSTIAAVYHFGRTDWKRAGAWGLLAGLSRPNGFLLALPLGLIAAQRLWHALRAGDPAWTRRGAALLATAGAPVVGMLVFTSYLFALTGVWFVWRHSHAAWGRSYAGIGPFQAVWNRLTGDGVMVVAQQSPIDMLNALGLVFALLMIWPVYRKIGWPWAVYVLVSVGAPVFAGGVLSMGRLTSSLFPLFLALAAILPSRAVPGWAAAFAMLQGLCAALFFTWRQLY
jgi:hypothetical protein